MQMFVEKEDREWLLSTSASDELNTHVITDDKEVSARKYLLYFFRLPSNMLIYKILTQEERAQM